MPTQSEIKAALAKLQAVADAIKAAKRIPSGNLCDGCVAAHKLLNEISDAGAVRVACLSNTQ